MASFNSFCESIIISFICPKCGHKVVSDSLYVPFPDLSAERNCDSMNSEDTEVFCEKCGHAFRVTIYNAMYGGNVEVEDVDNVDVEEEYSDSEIDYDNDHFDLTPENITAVLDEIESLSVSTKEYLYRQLYAGAITSMEAFLSSTLVKAVLSNNESKRKFVEKYIPYSKEHMPFSSIFERMDRIDGTIQETLRGLVYHNLGKIKPIYKDVLDIDLGDISSIMNSVRVRHDIVHRSGRDKDGKMHIIKRKDVIDLVEKISFLMIRVDSMAPTPFFAAATSENGEARLPF